MGEHHFNEFGANPSPEVVLTYVLAKTERLRVMPAVVVSPLHHPLRVAEHWATMDLLSGGVDKQVACDMEECAANGHRPGPVNSSYFLHFADTPEENGQARRRQIRFFHENALASMKTARRANTKSYD